MAIAAVHHDQQWLDITYTDGTTGRFLGSWLRDNIASGRHHDNGQRTFDINFLPRVAISGVTRERHGVVVSFAPEGLTETFDEVWLRDHLMTSASVLRPILWGHEQQSSLEFSDLDQLINDPSHLHDWLIGVRDLGFGLVENVPTTPGSILSVVDLFGYIRETNYGQIFDVRAESDPANRAFTSREIGVHTDNPYRDPVPGLQLLHCLVNESDGGDNQICDGFAAADLIRRDHPEAFDLLARCPVRFRFLETGSADLEAFVPLIELNSRGDIMVIRYNCRSAQPFEMGSDQLVDYYDAYRLLGEALHNPAAIIEFRLEAGQLMILDNQRILHGRSGYNHGKRHLQGCYADKDSLRSRIRLLEAQ